ncbi:HxxPF-repeated domain-containing protein, partial [Izhakiella capsodis]
MSDDIKDIEALKRAVLKSKVNALLKQRNNSHSKGALTIPLADRKNILPLSFAQQRLWFLCQLDSSASLAYHISATLKLKGPLERPNLLKAFNDVISRHESLRTRFVVINGCPCQKIDTVNSTFSIEYHDLRTFTSKERDKKRDVLSKRERSTPFDLSKDSLIRGKLLQLADDEHILIVTQHHIISDGWSVGILIHELGMLYQSACTGNSPHLKELSVQYADYAKWQQQLLRGDNLRESLDFWKSHLQGAPALIALSTDHPRPKVQTYQGGQVPVQFNESLVSSLQKVSQYHGTTLFMTLLAGWSVVLSRLSGQKDIVIGTPIANRPQRELEGLIGFFVNTLALRININRCKTVKDLLAEVRQQTLDAYTHQEVPFDKVVEALQSERSLNHSPVFQVMLALNNTPQKHLKLSGLELSLIEQQHDSAHFDLTLSLAEDAGKITGYLEYSSDLFEHHTAERIVSYLTQVFTEMIRDDTQNIQSLQILPPAEYRQVTLGFNSTQTNFPREKRVHTLFEEQVRRTPQALAVLSEADPLTYDSLN